MTQKNFVAHFFVSTSSHKTKSEVARPTLASINNTMNLTKSVRELASNIDTAPVNYDVDDDVSGKYCCSSVLE